MNESNVLYVNYDGGYRLVTTFNDHRTDFENCYHCVVKAHEFLDNDVPILFEVEIDNGKLGDIKFYNVDIEGDVLKKKDEIKIKFIIL